MARDVVVATDGSRQAATAVRWAAGFAARTGAALRIVAVREPWIEVHEVPVDVDELRERIATTAVETAEQLVREVAPELTVTSAQRSGPVVEELVDEAEDAALLVVGARGRGGFTGMLLGSTSLRLTSHAAGPVAVIRQVPEIAQGVVVAGTDGTELSEPALAFAFAHAAASGAKLIVSYAIQQPYVLGVEAGYGLWSEEVISDGNALVQEQIGPLRAEHRQVSVEVRIAQGHPGSALVQESAHADLVVVGSRGRGMARSWLLGSVSHTVLQHAD